MDGDFQPRCGVTEAVAIDPHPYRARNVNHPCDLDRVSHPTSTLSQMPTSLTRFCGQPGWETSEICFWHDQTLAPHPSLTPFWKHGGEIASVPQIPTVTILIPLLRRRSEFRPIVVYQDAPAILPGKCGSADGSSTGRVHSAFGGAAIPSVSSSLPTWVIRK